LGGNWVTQKQEKSTEMCCFRVIAILMLKFEIVVFRIFCQNKKLKEEMISI